MNATAQWEARRLGDFDIELLYEILSLRQTVFVVEQACAYLDCDGLDQIAWHLFLRENNRLLAYQRCLPPGRPYEESSIGRIMVPEAGRGCGLGRTLVQRGIDFNFATWPDSAIRIGAQARLTEFYASLGFHVDGAPYMEDGIEHIEMILSGA